MKDTVSRIAALAALIGLLAVGAANGARIAYYNCNEASGVTLTDATGNGHTAYLYNGVSRVNDPWGGKALSLAGGDTQQYGMVSGIELLGIDGIKNQGSIKFWFYTPADAPYGPYMDFHNGWGTDWTDTRLSVFSRNAWNPNPHQQVAIISNGTSSAFLWGPYSTDGQGNFLDRNRWTHVVVTWGQHSYLYWNGAQVAAWSDSPKPEITGINWWIGRSYANGNQYYTGYMDEIALWNNQLSSAEVLSRYNTAVAAMSSSIAGHVDLQDVNAGFDSSKVAIEVRLRAPGSTAPTSTFYTLLDSNGNYRISPVTPSPQRWPQDVLSLVPHCG